VKAATQRAVLEAVRNLNVWRRADEREPHKPLLLLLALSRLQQGGDRPVSFSDVQQRLDHLLRQFGPPRKAYHPEYPFWRLQNDGLWQVTSATPLKSRASNTDPLKSELIEKRAEGGFSEPVWRLLKADPRLVDSIIRMILAAHFPDSIHEDILSYVGLSLLSDAAAPRSKAPRDSRFAEDVLRAYGRCCAVCGYDVRIGGSSDLGLEAAHIKWHQAGGSDDVPNGLALCTIHHKALDRGAIGISEELRVLVSCDVSGRSVKQWFDSFIGKALGTPGRSDWLPAAEYVRWHRQQVFRPPTRECPTSVSVP